MANIKGSITGQKQRYNDNYAVYFNGVDKYLYTDNTFDIIDNANDWTLSFFFTRETKGDASTLFDCRPLVAGQEGGINIFIIEEVGNRFTLRFNNGFNAPSSSAFTIEENLNYNSLYHLTLVHDSTADTISFYINTILVNTLSTATRVINSANTQYALLGATIVPVGTNQFCHKGIIRDFKVLDKQVSETEINFDYQKGTYNTSTDANILCSNPLNNVAFNTKNTIIRNTLHVENGNQSKIIFNFTPVAGDSLKSEVIVDTDTGAVGFKDQNTAAFDNDHYILFVSGNVYGYQKNGSFTLTAQVVNPGDIMEAVINGGNVDLKVNNVLIHTYVITGTLANLRPFIYAREPKIASFQNSTWNGTLLTNADVLSNFRTSLDDKNQLDVVSNYNYAKTGANGVPMPFVAMNYTPDELGLNSGTSTFTAYADYYTRVLGANFAGGGDAIVYKGEEKRFYGLKFDSASGHYLDISGLNTAKTNGYTFLVAFANKTDANLVSGQDSIFSHIGTEGDSRKFQIEGASSVTKYLRCVFPSGVGTASTASYADNDFDNSKIQFASFALSPDKNYFLTYDRLGNKRGYGQGSFNTNVNQLNSINVSFPLSFGFNEITTPTTRIGYNGTNSLDGILCYFAIVEGLMDQATIKRHFNNNLLANPRDFEVLGLKLAFFADLNNPFDDAGTIKIPDLGENNLTVVAASALDASWNTLAGVQSSQVELKSLY